MARLSIAIRLSLRRTLVQASYERRAGLCWIASLTQRKFVARSSRLKAILMYKCATQEKMP